MKKLNRVYVVDNGDRVTLAVFATRKQANTFVREIGKKFWNEGWSVTSIKLNEIQSWIYNDYPRKEEA